MKGRPPVPIETHQREGTFRPSRHGTGPVLAAGRRPIRAPRGTPKNIAAVFRELARAGGSIFDGADAPLVLAAAVQLYRARQALEDIEERGALVEVRRVGRDGSELIRDEANPSLHIEREAFKEFRLLADRLGIGPVSRARLTIAGKEGRAPEDELPGLGEVAGLRAIAGGKAS